MQQYENDRTTTSGASGISGATREVLEGLRDVFRAEARLVITEARESVGGFGKHGIYGAICGFIALMGILPLIAFLVIGLGRILNDNYWLSSLIIGLVACIGGALFARSFFKKAIHHDLTFPRSREKTRDVIDRSSSRFGSNVRRLTEFRDRRNNIEQFPGGPQA